MILIANTPEGQKPHYWSRSFGKHIGGRAWGWYRKSALPPRTHKLTILSPYPDRVGADWVAPYELIHWAKSWTEVIEDLKLKFGSTAKVAVIPDATIQYFID